MAWAVEAVVVLAEAEGLVDDFAVSAMCERLAAGDRSTSHFIASLGHQLATTKGILAPVFFGEPARAPAEAAPPRCDRATPISKNRNKYVFNCFGTGASVPSTRAPPPPT